jgi:hypothetical protein
VVEIKRIKEGNEVLYHAVFGDEIITDNSKDIDAVKERAGDWARKVRKGATNVR